MIDSCPIYISKFRIILTVSIPAEILVCGPDFIQFKFILLTDKNLMPVLELHIEILVLLESPTFVSLLPLPVSNTAFVFYTPGLYLDFDVQILGIEVSCHTQKNLKPNKATREPSDSSRMSICHIILRTIHLGTVNPQKSGRNPNSKERR